MIPLINIISNLSKEEQNKFHSFLKKRNKNSDSPKLKLFKLILESKYASKEFPMKIYGKENKMAYHQLRKRLFHELIDFIASERFNQEEESEMEVTKLILAGKHLIESKNYETGFKLLAKAEKMAQEDNMVQSLNEIYNLTIHFSHKNPVKNLEETITKLEQNRVQLIQESNLNMAYAMVKDQLETYHLKGIAIEIEELLDQVFDRFEITEKAGNNYKTLYQLVQIVSASANITKDYYQIAPFVTTRYQIISNQEEESSRHVFFHIKLLYFMANIFFREKKFDRSNFYLNKMKELIASSGKKYERIFDVKRKVLKTLNLNYLGENEQASELIEEVIASNKDSKNKDYLDALIVSSLVNFQKKNYKKIQTIYSNLHASDTWYTKTMGANWVMNKNLIEILTHIELENIDYADSRLESFLFKNKEYLKQDARATIFLKYLKMSYTHPEKLQTKKIIDSFYDSVETKPRLREDIYIMSFFAYLKAKMFDKEVYETTLDLVRGIS